MRWGNIIPNLESNIELLSKEKSNRGRKSNQISGVPINHPNHHFYNRPLAFIHTTELLLEVRQQCQRHSPIHWHNINLLAWLQTNIWPCSRFTRGEMQSCAEGQHSHPFSKVCSSVYASRLPSDLFLERKKSCCWSTRHCDHTVRGTCVRTMTRRGRVKVTLASRKHFGNPKSRKLNNNTNSTLKVLLLNELRNKIISFQPSSM